MGLDYMSLARPAVVLVFIYSYFSLLHSSFAVLSTSLGKTFFA